MYEAWYGFREKPFNLTPDPRYLFLSPRHAEAFAHLEFGRQERGGFILVTGEVGTGKTTLVRYFLSRLPETTRSAVVLFPAVTASELLAAILAELGIAASGPTLKDHVDALHLFLLDARKKGQDVVLVIDEAQGLSTDVLEHVRLVSNLETDTEKLIQIVLVGQSELRAKLAQHGLRQLAQRVTARYHIEALSRADSSAYLRHRIGVAGGESKVRFTADAIDAIHTLSGGIPRLLSLIADRALLAGYVAGVRSVSRAMVQQAAREVTDRRPRRWARPLAAAAAGLALAAAGFALARVNAPSRPESATSVALPGPPGAQGLTTVTERGPSSPLAPLLPLLEGPSRSSSLRAATTTLARLWGGSGLERTPMRAHLGLLRRLDLPAVVELFHPARRDACYATLLALDDESALVSVMDGPPVRVAAPELDQLFTRDAILLWPDSQGLARTPRSPATTEWTRWRLTELGYPSDVALAEIVARFQRDTGIVADGVVGQRTVMALYALIDGPRPRLSLPLERARS